MLVHLYIIVLKLSYNEMPAIIEALKRVFKGLCGDTNLFLGEIYLYVYYLLAIMYEIQLNLLLEKFVECKR